MSQENTPQATSKVAQCPECQSSFRLTAQHLEAAKGWVQCGVCGHVFFSGLLSPAAPVAPAATPQTTNPQAIATNPTPTAAPVAPPPPADTQPVAQPKAAAEFNPDLSTKAPAPAFSGLSNRMADDESPSTMTFGPKLESIILVDPNATEESMDPGPLPVIPSQKDKSTGYGSSVTPTSVASSANATSNWIPRQVASHVSDNVSKKPRKGSLAWLWWIIAILLLMFLVTQVLWFKRDSLAANQAWLRPVLAQMCGAMDCTLNLPHDPKQVVILGSDLQTEEDGRLILAINLANKAKSYMAWPVLELTLTDVEDQPLARRVFAPSEYVRSPKQEATGIAQESEVPITLTLQSRDIRAAGYRIRTFY